MQNIPRLATDVCLDYRVLSLPGILRLPTGRNRVKTFASDHGGSNDDGAAEDGGVGLGASVLDDEPIGAFVLYKFIGLCASDTLTMLLTRAVFGLLLAC